MDLSILDRISNILVPESCFASYLTKQKSLDDEVNRSLRDNIFFDAMSVVMSTKYIVKFYATRWSLNIR